MESYLLGAYMGLEGSEGRGKQRKKIVFKNKCDHIICTMKMYVTTIKLCDILKIDASR